MKTIIQKTWMLLAMLCISVSVSAYDFEIDGIYYTITSFTDMTCEVTSGDDEYQGDVIIPSEIIYNSRKLYVTSIDKKAFKDCSSLTSVSIPNSITSINGSTFRGCSSLTSVTIPNSVTSIGSEAFRGCSSLTSVTIPNSVTSIDWGAFEDCTSLTSVTIPNSVTSIDDSTFNGCSSLTSVTIPNSVTSIGSGAFCGCSSLTSVTIPNSVTSIDNSTFNGCSSLTSVIIPNSVTSIGRSAFEDCTSLTSVSIPNSVTSIGAEAFWGCSSLISVTLSNQLQSIPYGLFKYCESLEFLEIPGSVETISQGYYSWGSYLETTFYNCTKLNKLSLYYSAKPLSVGYSGGWGFTPSSWTDWTNRITELYINRELENSIPVPNLEKLEIGENVVKVQIKDIDKIDKLITIYSYALTPPELPTMSNKQYMNIMVYVPEVAIDAYRNADSWKTFWNLAPINGKNEIENDIDTNTPVQIYTINGIETRDEDSLPPGIYILRQGSKTKKIMLGR